MGVQITGCASIEEPGTINQWGGTVANIPTGWLFCDGSTVNKADYPALWGVIADIYGASTAATFVLPDFRNRFLIGAKLDVVGIPKTDVTGANLQSGGAYRNTFTGSAASSLSSTSATAGITNVSPSGHTHVVTCTNIPIIPPFWAVPFIIKT